MASRAWSSASHKYNQVKQKPLRNLAKSDMERQFILTMALCPSFSYYCLLKNINNLLTTLSTHFSNQIPPQRSWTSFLCSVWDGLGHFIQVLDIFPLLSLGWPWSLPLTWTSFILSLWTTLGHCHCKRSQKRWRSHGRCISHVASLIFSSLFFSSCLFFLNSSFPSRTKRKFESFW